MIHSRLLLCLLLTSSLAVSGCGAWWLPRAHKIEIQQGNLLPPDVVNEISEGMSRREVVAALGEPVTTSLFNKNRWDYVYSINRSGEKPEAKRLTLFFQGDTVTRIEKKGLENSDTQ